jgi:hypothetical protein
LAPSVFESRNQIREWRATMHPHPRQGQQTIQARIHARFGRHRSHEANLGRLEQRGRGVMTSWIGQVAHGDAQVGLQIGFTAGEFGPALLRTEQWQIRMGARMRGNRDQRRGGQDVQLLPGEVAGRPDFVGNDVDRGLVVVVLEQRIGMRKKSTYPSSKVRMTGLGGKTVRRWRASSRSSKVMVV